MGLTVSLGDGRSSDPDFALGRSVGREVPGLCEIDELDLARRDGDTNGSVLEELGSEDRRESANHRQWEDGGWRKGGRTLRSPSFQIYTDSSMYARRKGRLDLPSDDLDESEGEKLLRSPSDGSTSVDRNLQPPSRRLLHRTKHELVCQSCDDSLGPKHLLGSDRTVEDELGKGTAVLDFPVDAFLDQFPDGGDSDHDRRSEAAEVSDAVADGGVGEGLDRPVSYGNSRHDGVELDGELKDVLGTIMGSGRDGRDRGSRDVLRVGGTRGRLRRVGRP
jgi:hypothetical protein